MKRIFRLAFVVGLAALSACVDVRVPTEALVEVTADPDLARDIHALHVEIWGNDGEDTPFVLREERDVVGVAFPYTLGIAPRRRDPLRAYRFTLTAVDNVGRVLAVVRVHSGFMRERRLRVPVRFESLCRGVLCSELDKTCRAGRCVPAYVPPTALDHVGASEDGGVPYACDDRNGGCEATRACNAIGSDIVCGFCAAGLTEQGDTGCSDHNECMLGTDDCHDSATCENTRGSFDCTCPQGSLGSGHGLLGCVAAGQPEVCNYQDDDLDGQVDEGFAYGELPETRHLLTGQLGSPKAVARSPLGDVAVAFLDGNGTAGDATRVRVFADDLRTALGATPDVLIGQPSDSHRMLWAGDRFLMVGQQRAYACASCPVLASTFDRVGAPILAGSTLFSSSAHAYPGTGLVNGVLWRLDQVGQDVVARRFNVDGTPLSTTGTLFSLSSGASLRSSWVEDDGVSVLLAYSVDDGGATFHHRLARVSYTGQVVAAPVSLPATYNNTDTVIASDLQQPFLRLGGKLYVGIHLAETAVSDFRLLEVDPTTLAFIAEAWAATSGTYGTRVTTDGAQIYALTYTPPASPYPSVTRLNRSFVEVQSPTRVLDQSGRATLTHEPFMRPTAQGVIAGAGNYSDATAISRFGCGRRVSFQLSPAAHAECPGGGWVLGYDFNGLVESAGPGQALDAVLPMSATTGDIGLRARCPSTGDSFRDWSPWAGQPATAAGVTTLALDGIELSHTEALVCNYFPTCAFGQPSYWTTPRLPLEVSLHGTCTSAPVTCPPWCVDVSCQ